VRDVFLNSGDTIPVRPATNQALRFQGPFCAQNAHIPIALPARPAIVFIQNDDIE